VPARSLALVALLSTLGGSTALAQPDPPVDVPCPVDPSLERAAEALITRHAPPTGAELLATVHAVNGDAPVVDAVVILDGDQGRRQRFLARTRERRDGPLVCGEARLEGRWLVLAAPQAGRIRVLGGGALQVELADGWRSPRVHAQDAEGTHWEAEARADERIELPSDLVAPVRVQLVASGASGPRPVAERIVSPEDVEGATEVVIPSSDRPIAERFATLRGERHVRVNRLLARVATAHAEGVCRERRVSHLSTEGDPRDRLARAGIQARHVGEVVARAEDTARAYEALLRSPSHRAALIDRRFTDAGIGHATDDAGWTCLVVLLAAWPRAVPPR
jgi:hypothetical protein